MPVEIDQQRRLCFTNPLVSLLHPSVVTPLAACVRSPWAYYRLSGSQSGDENPAADSGNEALPSLRSLTNESAQWTSAGWVGDGSQRGLEVEWTSDPLGLDAVAGVRSGSMLVGVAIAHPLAVATSETIINIGGRRVTANGVVKNGLELKISDSNRANVTVYDDQGVNVGATVNQNGVFAAGPDATPAALFVLIDNRPGGARTVSIHQYELGTSNRISKVQSIAALDSITGGAADCDKVFSVGYSRKNGSTTYRHYSGALNGLHIVNFGDRQPTDVDSVMDQLSRSYMLPGPFMEGL